MMPAMNITERQRIDHFRIDAHLPRAIRRQADAGDRRQHEHHAKAADRHAQRLLVRADLDHDRQQEAR